MKSVTGSKSRRSTRHQSVRSSLLERASKQALEKLEQRVLMSTTLAAWNFSSTSTGSQSPATTAGTGTASSLGMSSGNTALVSLGSPTAGTFSLTVTDSTSAYTYSGIAYNATPATVQSDLRTLGASGASFFTVTGASGKTAGGPYSVLLNSSTGGDPTAVLSGSSSLTGGTFTVTNQASPPSPALGAVGPDNSAVASDTIAATGGSWKIVGNNGWNTAAPIGSQGAQFSVTTTNYQNVSLQFDWGVSSTKANGQLVVEYTLDNRPASPTWVVAPASGLSIPSGDTLTELLSNSSNANIVQGSYFQNIGDNGTSGQYQNGLTANFSSVTTGGPSGTGVNNDPYFAVRLVNAATGLAVQNGTNPATAINITNAALTSNVATITAANTFTAGNSVTVSNLPSPYTSLNGTFTIASATATSFTYALTGSNIASAATTGTALSVSAPSNTSGNWRLDEIQISGTNTPITPVIETPPAMASAASGSNATFTAVAQTYDPTTTVTWEVSTTGPTGTFNPISSDSSPADSASTPSYNSTNGYTTDTLTVPATAAKNGQYYEAIFSDTATPASATTASAQLTVPSNPVITTQPAASTTVNYGTPIKLVAAATIAGTTAPSVQWKVSTTGANGTYTNISDPQDVSNVFVTTGPSSTTSTYTFTPLESQTGNYYEAVFSSTVNGVPVTATTNSAGITVIGTAIAQWSFNSIIAAPDNSPPPSLGSGTLTSLGFNNQYNAVTSVTSDDITNSPTASTNSAAKGFNEDTWRIRGASNSGGTTNGWSNAAPEYSQGAEIDVPASGYDNFTLSFDWYSTTQGLRDLQVQYYDPVTSAWVNDGNPYIAASNDFYGVNTGLNPGSGVPTPVFVNLQGIADLATVSTLQVRLVGAYDTNLPAINDGNSLDPGPTHGQYASAATGGANEQQEINLLNVSGSSPTFTLTYGGVTTAPISYSQSTGSGFSANANFIDADSTAIQTALNALSTITAAGGVTVLNPNGNPNATGEPDDYTVIFNDPTNVAEGAITADSTNLGGGTASIQTGTNGVVQYNNSSGNWRFDNITVSGTNESNSPVVTVEPANATWTTQGVSTSVSFTSAAYSDTQSTDPIYVQWYEAPAGTVVTPNSTNGFTAVGSKVQTTITGGSSSNTLTVTNIGNDLTQNGDLYMAVFSNSSSALAYSDTATLAVVPPIAPTIASQPASESVLAGGTATFTASETNGSPVPEVVWEQNSGSGWSVVPAGDVQNPSASTQTTTSTLTISNVTSTNTGLQYRAVFYNAEAPLNADGVTGGVDTSAATLTVLSPETTITQWVFPGTVAAPDNSPSPTLNYAGAGNYENDNLSSGASMSTIGFTTANTGVAGEVAGDDITPTAGTVSSSFTENLLRVRNSSPGSWDNTAPNDTQGLQINVDTTGYSNVYMTYDWYATTQGIRDLQEEYSLDGGSTWTTLGSPLVATANDYYGASTSAGLSHLPVVFDLTGVTSGGPTNSGANNNPNLELRLVSAFDPTVLNSSGQPFEYTAASVPTSGIPNKYNGTSGNWRFGNFSIEALPSWLSPTSAATWNPANNTLAVTGAATIIADPTVNTATDPTALPTISASGATAALSFNPASGAATDFHIAGITLSSGATAIETSLDPTLVAKGTNAANHATNHDALVISAGSTTTDPTGTSNFNVGGGLLDLTDNDLIYHYSGGNGSTALSKVQGQFESAFDQGAYDGTTGLTSSAAATNANNFSGNTILGIIDNNDPNGPAYTSFDQETLSDANEILVKYTYEGDALLEGVVNEDAVQQFELGVQLTHQGIDGQSWVTGNFEYTSLGSVTSSDTTDLETGLTAAKNGDPVL